MLVILNGGPANGKKINIPELVNELIVPIMEPLPICAVGEIPPIESPVKKAVYEHTHLGYFFKYMTE